MQWNLFHGTRLIRKGGELTLSVERVELKSGARPKGVDINPDLTEGPKGKTFQQFLFSPADGEFSIGNIRPGVGGAFVVPFQQLDLGEDSERITEHLFSKFGETNQAFIAVVRGMDAPGTFGVIDGGGAGIPETQIDNPTILEAECLKENLGEIGIENQKRQVIGFQFPELLPELLKNDIEQTIAQEWAISWGQNIMPWINVRAPIEILPAPDKLSINDWEIPDVALAFEINNASVEILRMHKIELPPGQYRFWDLEHRPTGERLNRLIAAVCKGSKKLFAIYFDSGEYSERIQAIPLTGDSLELCTNEKCRKFLSLLGWI